MNRPMPQRDPARIGRLRLVLWIVVGAISVWMIVAGLSGVVAKGG